MTGSAIPAKAKAIYGAFLKKSDYDSLIQRSSVGAVTAYLKNTPRFKEAFVETDETNVHRGQVERILNERIFKGYIRLMKFSTRPKNGIQNFFIVKSEIEQVIKLIAAISTGTKQSFYLNFPAHLMDYISFDLEEAVRAENLKGLSKIFGNIKMYKPLIPYLEAEQPDVNKCITVLNSCYIGWAFSAINRDYKGRKKEQLKQFFLRKTDMDNILLCYRLKRFFDEDEERIKELILPFHYRVKAADIDTALKSQNSTDALIKLMADRCVSGRISIDENFPELAAARAHYNYFRHRLALTCDEIESLFSLIVLAETERMNLQKVIEGIRYGEAPSEIEQLVII